MVLQPDTEISIHTCIIQQSNPGLIIQILHFHFQKTFVSIGSCHPGYMALIGAARTHTSIVYAHDSNEDDNLN